MNVKSRWAKWGLMILPWMAFAPIATSFSYSFLLFSGRKASWAYVARRQFVSYVIWGAVLTPIILWMCRRFPIDKQNWPRTFPLHLLASVAVAALHAALRVPLDPLVYPNEAKGIDPAMFKAYFFANGYNDIWVYFLVAFLSLGLTYYGKYRDRDVRAANLETQLVQAQLQVLKTQLQPHFLFNTLHSISTLMHRDVEAADRMITRLSDLLRVTLDSGGAQEVSLKRELEFVQGYVEIEKARFQDRLTVLMDIEPETLDACIPNMLLQPLVENAVRHGIAKRAGPGRIELWARRDNGKLRLAVRDDGPGMLPARLMRGSGGVGLHNTQARLQFLYGAEHWFQVVSGTAGGMEVTIEIPFRTLPDDQDCAGPLTLPLSARPIANEV